MRVFVFEFVSGGGFAGQPMVSSLVGEGDMMLAAVVRDLLEIPGVQVSICRDCRLQLPNLPCEVIWVEDDWQAAWREGLRSAEAVLPIAPETDGILEFLCDDVQAQGRLLLNSRTEGVMLAASKRATLDRLSAAGVSAVDFWEPGSPTDHRGAFVVKPDRGVGCRDTHLLSNERAVKEFFVNRPDAEPWIIQPYVSGEPASLSLMVGDDCACLLGCNVQRVAQVDDGFVLLGCIVNGMDDANGELAALGRSICECIDGLWGYVGVDLILTDDGPVVLEINPRLTTSYVGLSRSVGRNVAKLLLSLVDDDRSLPAHSFPASAVHVDLELGCVA